MFTVTSDQVIYFCSFVTAVWGVVKVVQAFKKPGVDLKAQVDRNTELLHNDNRRIKEMEDTSKLTLQCLMVLMDHAMNGNSGLDKLKETKSKVEDYLINK